MAQQERQVSKPMLLNAVDMNMGITYFIYKTSKMHEFTII